MTTTSITAVSVSMRSAQSTLRSPEAIQVKSVHARVVMLEADVDEGDPRQDHRDQQQRGGDQFGQPRAGGRRLDRSVAVFVRCE